MVKSKRLSWQYLVIGVLLSCAFALGVTWLFSGTIPSVREFARAKVGSKEISVVLSKTSTHSQQGLSRRKYIGADGMLFLFSGRQQTSFWMYQMRFALDFVWIDGNTIVQLDRDVPPPVSFSTPASSIAVVTPAQPVTAVLEVNAGFIDEHALQVGDEFRLVGKPSLGAW